MFATHRLVHDINHSLRISARLELAAVGVELAERGDEVSAHIEEHAVDRLELQACVMDILDFDQSVASRVIRRDAQA